jgi:murein DD-endopeptidase MepM/ murein hydrolase activator NlpD
MRAVFSDFIWPSRGIISGVYGSQRILNGQPRRPHFGVDVAAPTGTEVVAPAAGVVRMAHPDMYFSGGTLILDHGYGVTSSFLHLSKIHVKPGEAVEQGQKIADIGATGRVTGPHLDWRMNWHKVRVDPQPLVGPMPSRP